MQRMFAAGAGAPQDAWWWTAWRAAKSGDVPIETHAPPVPRVTDSFPRGPAHPMRSSTPAHARSAPASSDSSSGSGSGGMTRLWHLFRRPERFSAAHVRELDAQLRAASEVPAGATDAEAAAAVLAHKAAIIEAMRELAEVLVWGDQHGASFFEDFLEAQMLQTLMGFLALGDHDVTVQLVQTLGILIENLSDTRFLYYLLSNNYINHLIETGLGTTTDTSDTSSSSSSFANSGSGGGSGSAGKQTVSDAIRDSDLVACYVSFLKTLSLRLDARTVNFFFNEQTRTFPLYTQALRLFNHPDGMVRISVRVLTLNVFRVDVPALRAFIVHDTAPAYFRDLCALFARQCARLGALARTGHAAHRQPLAALVAELGDNLSYMQDIFDLGVPDLATPLAQRLLHTALVPILLGALVPGAHPDPHTERIPPRAALFLLAHVYHTLRLGPLLNALTELLFSAHPTVPLPRLCPRVFRGTDEGAEALRWRVLRGAAGRDGVALPVFMLAYALVCNGSIDRRLLLECGFVSDTVERTVERTTRLLSTLVPDDGKKEGATPSSTSGGATTTGGNGTTGVPLASGSNSNNDDSGSGDDGETREWQETLRPILFNPSVPLEEQPLADKPVANLFEGATCELGEEKNSPEQQQQQQGGDATTATTTTKEGKQEECETETVAVAKEEEENNKGTLADDSDDDDEWGRDLEGLGTQDAGKPYLGLLVDNVMRTLQSAAQYRVVTVQMGVLLLKQLSRFRVFAGTAAFVMDAARRAQYDAAFDRSVEAVKHDLGGPLGDIFLELFEDAAAACRRPVYFESILGDGRNVWPPTSSPESRLGLAQRLPAGEAEATQTAILVFLTLRRYRLELAGARDTLLPLRALPMPAGLGPGAPFRFARTTVCAAFRTPAVAARPQGRTLPKFFAVVDAALLVVDVAPRELSEAARRRTWPAAGVVDAAVPIERVDVEARRDGIQVTCHPRRWSVLMLFDTRTALLEAHHMLDAGRSRARQYKMGQIYAGLGIPDATVSLPPRPCDFPDDCEASAPAAPLSLSSSFLRHFSLHRSSHEQPRSSSDSPAHLSFTSPTIK